MVTATAAHRPPYDQRRIVPIKTRADKAPVRMLAIPKTKRPPSRSVGPVESYSDEGRATVAVDEEDDRAQAGEDESRRLRGRRARTGRIARTVVPVGSG